MKKLLLIVTLVLSTNVFAGGKLIFEPTKNFTTGKNQIKAGLSVWQKLPNSDLFFSNTWLGMGATPLEDEGASEYKLNYYNVKQSFGIQPLNFLQLELGYQLNHNSYRNEHIGFVKGSIKLW